jgi:hypothetical protein
LCLVLLTAGAQAKEPAAFKRDVAGAEIDWTHGILTAQAGAAADLRMPSPNAARPGAERRARAAAEQKLRAALRALGLDAKADTVTERAAVSRIEYQSNGGVILWLSLRVSDVATRPGGPRALKIATMPFQIAPTIVAGDKEVRVGIATYRPAADCPKDALPVARDQKGRLALPAARKEIIDYLAGSAVVIYLEKAQP